MKKLISLMLCAALSVSLASCGNTPDSVPAPEVTPSADSQSQPAEESTPETPPASETAPIPEPDTSYTPEPEVTPEPTPVPEITPTPEPTHSSEPVDEPTPEITPEPTAEPTSVPTPEPTSEPTPVPTPEPTPIPTPEPAVDTSSDPADIFFTIDYSGQIPAETGERKLGDAELKSLAGKTPADAAKTISTLADAYAWLKQEGYSTSGASLNGYGSDRFRLENSMYQKELSWAEMSTLINILLEGDYDEVGTIMCTLVADDPGWPFFYISFNYVKAGGWYYITDPVCHLANTGMPFCRSYTVKTSTLALANEIFSEINSGFTPITLVSYTLHTGEIIAKIGSDPVSITFEALPNLQYLYRVSAAELDAIEKRKEQEKLDEVAAWAETGRKIRVESFNMPAAIGNLTFDYDYARSLIGKDPAVIADNVKTVGDVLQYMIASRFGYYSDFFGTPWYDGWGFDAPGDYQIQENYGCCCGGYANAVSYLLQGDYEKVGTLRWVGGGNHTISWVYTQGKYYVFDFTQYSSMGNYNNYNCPVTVLDRLEDFYDWMPDIYSSYLKSEVVIMVAFEAGEAMYPSNWQDPPNFTGLTFPKEADGKITLIYQKDPAYGVIYKNLDVNIPGWNAP